MESIDIKEHLEKLDVIFDSTNHLQTIIDTIQNKIKSLNKVYLEFQMKKPFILKPQPGSLNFKRIC